MVQLPLPAGSPSPYPQPTGPRPTQLPLAPGMATPASGPTLYKPRPSMGVLDTIRVKVRTRDQARSSGLPEFELRPLTERREIMTGGRVKTPSGVGYEELGFMYVGGRQYVTSIKRFTYEENPIDVTTKTYTRERSPHPLTVSHTDFVGGQPSYKVVYGDLQSDIRRTTYSVFGEEPKSVTVKTRHDVSGRLDVQRDIATRDVLNLAQTSEAAYRQRSAVSEYEYSRDFYGRQYAEAAASVESQYGIKAFGADPALFGMLRSAQQRDFYAWESQASKNPLNVGITTTGEIVESPLAPKMSPYTKPDRSFAIAYGEAAQREVFGFGGGFSSVTGDIVVFNPTESYSKKMVTPETTFSIVGTAFNPTVVMNRPFNRDEYIRDLPVSGRQSYFNSFIQPLQDTTSLIYSSGVLLSSKDKYGTLARNYRGSTAGGWLDIIQPMGRTESQEKTFRQRQVIGDITSFTDIPIEFGKSAIRGSVFLNPIYQTAEIATTDIPILIKNINQYGIKEGSKQYTEYRTEREKGRLWDYVSAATLITPYGLVGAGISKTSVWTAETAVGIGFSIYTGSEFIKNPTTRNLGGFVFTAGPTIYAGYTGLARNKEFEYIRKDLTPEELAKFELRYRVLAQATKAKVKVSRKLPYEELEGWTTKEISIVKNFFMKNADKIYKIAGSFSAKTQTTVTKSPPHDIDTAWSTSASTRNKLKLELVKELQAADPTAQYRAGREKIEKFFPEKNAFDTLIDWKSKQRLTDFVRNMPPISSLDNVPITKLQEQAWRKFAGAYVRGKRVLGSEWENPELNKDLRGYLEITGSDLLARKTRQGKKKVFFPGLEVRSDAIMRRNFGLVEKGTSRVKVPALSESLSPVNLPQFRKSLSKFRKSLSKFSVDAVFRGKKAVFYGNNGKGGSSFSTRPLFTLKGDVYPSTVSWRSQLGTSAYPTVPNSFSSYVTAIPTTDYASQVSAQQETSYPVVPSSVRYPSTPYAKEYSSFPYVPSFVNVPYVPSFVNVPYVPSPPYSPPYVPPYTPPYKTGYPHPYPSIVTVPVQPPSKNLLRLKSSEDEKKRKKAYKVQIKRRGKFISIGSSMPFGKALEFGSKKTRESLAATFRLKEAGTTDLPDSQYPVSTKFFRNYAVKQGRRVDLPLTFIQRRGTRLGTSAEVSEIGYERKSKRRTDQLMGGLFSV